MLLGIFDDGLTDCFSRLKAILPILHLSKSGLFLYLPVQTLAELQLHDCPVADNGNFGAIMADIKIHNPLHISMNYHMIFLIE
jgi:hypothetical protein